MSEPLIFMMGNFSAEFPQALLYAKNHMWGVPTTGNSFRFGLSAYAVRLLQDVYFFDLTIEPGMNVKARQEIGSIESKKAESSLYSPVAGTVEQINKALLDDPTAINVDKYGSGWLMEMQLDAEAIAQLLSPSQYIEHLGQAWEVAQRTIKGQVNG
jgi:glycine cleavage system H protein